MHFKYPLKLYIVRPIQVSIISFGNLHHNFLMPQCIFMTSELKICTLVLAHFKTNFHELGLVSRTKDQSNNKNLMMLMLTNKWEEAKIEKRGRWCLKSVLMTSLVRWILIIKRLLGFRQFRKRKSLILKILRTSSLLILLFKRRKNCLTHFHWDR